MIDNNLVLLRVAGIEEGELSYAKIVHLALQREIAAGGTERPVLLHTDDRSGAQGTSRHATGVILLQQPDLVDNPVLVLELELVFRSVCHYCV